MGLCTDWTLFCLHIVWTYCFVSQKSDQTVFALKISENRLKLSKNKSCFLKKLYSFAAYCPKR